MISKIISSYNTGNYKKYFEYDENLKVVVSVVTAALIGLYNTLSGTIIFYVAGEIVFGIYDPAIWIIILFILPGLLIGCILTYVSITLVDIITGNTQIENYSYLRLVLLVSVMLFLMILLLSILILIANGI